MSEATTAPQDGAVAAPSAGVTSGSLLSQMAAGGPPAGAAPLPTGAQPAPTGIEPPARPEWVPEKFWDPKTGKVRDEDMGKSYTNLEKLLGGDRVPKPTSDDDEEGWNRWYAAAGRPEAPDKYEIEKPAELPEALGYDDELDKSFRNWAFANGLNQRQTKALHDGYAKMQAERYTAGVKQMQEDRSRVEIDLQREHGSNYDAWKAQASTALRKYADADLVQYLDQTGLGNDPRLLRAFGKIGSELGAGPSRLKQGSSELGGGTAIDAQKSIADFRKKHAASLNDRMHPDHDSRTKELSGLYERAFPSAG